MKLLDSAPSNYVSRHRLLLLQKMCSFLITVRACYLEKSTYTTFSNHFYGKILLTLLSIVKYNHKKQIGDPNCTKIMKNHSISFSWKIIMFHLSLLFIPKNDNWCIVYIHNLRENVPHKLIYFIFTCLSFSMNEQNEKIFIGMYADFIHFGFIFWFPMYYIPIKQMLYVILLYSLNLDSFFCYFTIFFS